MPEPASRHENFCYDPVSMPPIWVNEGGEPIETRVSPRGLAAAASIRSFGIAMRRYANRLAALSRGSLRELLSAWAGVHPCAG